MMTTKRGAWMSLSAMTLVTAIATTTTGCGSSSTDGASIGTVDNAADLAALMDAMAVPMAGVFTNLANGAVVRTDGASARSDLTAALTASAGCPGGGTATFTSGVPSQVTFAACGLGGVVASGSVYVGFSAVPPSYSAFIEGGSLTLSGAASGTLTIVNGLIQWTHPATDANTYWQFTVSIGSSTICANSAGVACTF
jgi:hypothetical protein